MISSLFFDCYFVCHFLFSFLFDTTKLLSLSRLLESGELIVLFRFLDFFFFFFFICITRYRGIRLEIAVD